MTAKELARFCENSDRTIRRWINKAGRENPNLLIKLSDSKRSKKAANFTRAELDDILQNSSLGTDVVLAVMHELDKQNNI